MRAYRHCRGIARRNNAPRATAHHGPHQTAHIKKRAACAYSASVYSTFNAETQALQAQAASYSRAALRCESCAAAWGLRTKCAPWQSCRARAAPQRGQRPLPLPEGRGRNSKGAAQKPACPRPGAARLPSPLGGSGNAAQGGSIMRRQLIPQIALGRRTLGRRCLAA